MDTWLTVDPGTDYTGVAAWEAGEDWTRSVPPTSTALLRPNLPRSADWYERAMAQADELRRFIEALRKPVGRGFGGGAPRTRIVEMAIEWPEVWGGSAKADAAAKTGSTPKLCFLVGAFAHIAHDFAIPFRPVTVREWKGQLSKPQAIRRIRKVLGENCGDYQRDEWDAIGIGLFLKGHF